MKTVLAASRTLPGLAAQYIPGRVRAASAVGADAPENPARIRSFGAIRRLEPTVAA